MVVTKGEEAEIYASVEFLKWFTREENNLRFGAVSGYMPVLKTANNMEMLDRVIEEQGMEVAEKTYDCLRHTFGQMDNVTFYTNKSFKNGSDARKVLEHNLSDKAQADRKQVEAALAGGVSLEEACAPYLTEEAFDAWYEEFCRVLKEAAGI